MVFWFFIGLLFGLFCVLGLEVLAVVYVVDWIKKKNQSALDLVENSETCDLHGQSTIINFPSNKEGYVWILEPDKIPEVNSDDWKDKKEKNNYVEVVPVKRHAKIEDHLLILSGPGSSWTTIDLSNSTVLAVSGSNQSSRKWAKRYPIKIESKEPTINIYNNNPTIFLYTETSWEKESWCKALRIASTTEEKLQSDQKLIQNYETYLAALNSVYPSFTKPYLPFSDPSGRTGRTEPGRVRTFFKKLAKKASNKPYHFESKASGFSQYGSEKRVFENMENSRGSLQDLQSETALMDEKVFSDQGSLCLNLLFSRLFFDVKMSDKINNAILERIQRTLSSMRIPSYIREITCTNFDMGCLPPHINKLKPVQTDLIELMAFEVDFEFSGGVLVNVETRLDVGATELHNDFEEENSLGLLEGLEHFGRQFRSAHELNPPQFDIKDETGGTDGLKHSKSASWMTYTSRWKHIVNSIATKVNQVPLSLAIRVNSIKGTLRFHIKPPPSDQLWYGFVSMPEIDWCIESSIGERKISSNRIASLLGNRFKASIFSTMVLPNCGNISIPWMLSTTDDWAPLKAAPFIWINNENTLNNTKIHENIPKAEVSSSTSTIIKLDPIPKDEIVKSMVLTKEPSDVSQLDTSSSNFNTRLVNLEKQGSSSGSEASVNYSPPVVQRNLRGESFVPNREDSKMNLRGDSFVPNREDSKGNIRGDSFVPNREDSKVNLRGDSFVPNREDSKGIWRGDSFVPNREDSKGIWRGDSFVPNREDSQPSKLNRRRVMDFGKKMGDKLGENRRKLEEKSRHFVEKVKENINTPQ